MQWFDKILKERFSSINMEGTESDLDGIDSSDLWTQISKSIPQEEPKKSPSLWWRAFGSLLFISLIITGFIIFSYNNSINESISKNNDSPHKQVDNPRIKNSAKSIQKQASIVTELDEQNLKSESIAVSLSNTKTNKINKSSNSQLNTIPKISRTISNSNNSKEETKILTQAEQFPTKNGLGNNSRLSSLETAKNKNPHIEILQKRQENKGDDNVQTISKNNNSKNSLVDITLVKSNQETSTSASQTKINIVPLVRDWPQNLKMAINPQVVPPNTKPIKDNNYSSPWSTKISAQINTFNQLYKEGTTTETFAKQANESIDSLQYGYGVGVHLSYKLNKTWSFSTGLESNRYKNQLNTVLTTDTIVFVLHQQKYRNAKNIRTVKNTNKISTITIPLNFMYDYRLNQRFGVGTSIGLAYSFVTSQSGRLLSREGSIIDFNSDNNKQFENFISLRINPYIRYRLNDNFDLYLDVGYSIQNHGSSAVVDLKHSSTISSIGLGVKYNFN
jgi:opacity protein-like surface antigen